MKKLFLFLSLLSIGFIGMSCTESTTTTTASGILLADLTGMDREEIVDLFEGKDVVLTFREIQNDELPSGQFIRYVGFAAGQTVPAGSNIRIEIAVPVPAAPVIAGADSATVYVSVQGNPPTFDLTEGVTATDYQGNDIPWGNFLYILAITDDGGDPLGEVNFYKVGVYHVTYVAQNSGFTTTVIRDISVIVPPFDTNHTDDLRLTADYAGKSFITNGIGEVQVTSYTDGDTTNFLDPVSGTRFTVRYLGIDCPEATSKYDPWGIKASSFVRNILENADKIILQAEGTRQDGNGRYLAWVWYVNDGITRLLNLELVETAYAWSTGGAESQYSSVFTVAAAETQLTGRRIYGETDPDYDYSTSGTPVTIGTLLDNFNDYVGKKVTVTAVITTKIGNSIFLEENGRGIYLYAGYNLTNELQIGYQVTIQGLVPALFYEGKQLTNYSYDNMQLISTDNAVTITTISGAQIGQYVGRIVRIEGLIVQSVDPSLTNNAYSIVCRDGLGNSVTVRVDDYTAAFIPSNSFPVGTRFTVYGPVQQFYSSFQLMLPGSGNIQFE